MEYSNVPETPTGKQSRLPPVHMRNSAEKFNRHNRLVRQRSPPVPESDLNTSKLAVAFPGFSGIAEDIKPFSPNPFLDHGHKNMNQDTASKENLDVKRQYQARVRDENDVSILSETHPSLAKRHNKNTRFGQVYLPKIRKGPQPHMYISDPGLMQNAAAEPTAANVSKPLAINAHGSLTSIPNGSTQQTLNLPQGSNLTDIFSGIVRQAPPVSSQSVKPRASRFTSSKPQEAAETKAEGIAVPADERHLLRSIDTLQARVDELEKLPVQLETTNSNLEQKRLDLQAETQELEGRQRRDSAAGSTDAEDENVDGARASYEQLIHKNKRLETYNWALVRQKDIFVQDRQNLEQERDLYRERSATAESEAARLHAEIARLRSENTTIGQQHAQAAADLAAVYSDIEALARDVDTLAQDKEDLLAEIRHLRYTDQQGPAHDNSAQDVTPDFEGPDGPTDEHSRLQVDQQSEAQQTEQQGPAHDNGVMDLSDMCPDAESSSFEINQRNDSLTESRIKERAKAEQLHQRIEQLQLKSARDKAPSEDSSYNITYVSYAGQTGSCFVRKDLENERKARHQLRQAEASEGLVNNTIGHHVSAEQARQSSSSSVSTTRIRPHNSLADRTSSLLMDDFTMSKPPTTVDQAASLPVNEAAALPLPPLDLAPLDVVQETQQNTEAPPAQQTTEPAKKLTVSDEELDITIMDEEPTERPSQPPAVALAAVLESVQAERALQFTQLAKYQANYSRHDLNRRQRKQLLAKIIALTESVDRKADQIHNLHDLVADQNQKGQAMTQNQVDNTLQSLGLELPWQGIASSTGSSRSL
ncbi:MAG: hypothetical protein Q9226_000272 [Calogaya cf. arnoldii]